MTPSGGIPQSPDVLVVGLGATGTAALRATQAAGANAAGVDLRPEPASGGAPGGNYRTRVWGIFANGAVACSTPDRTVACTLKAVIIATGGIDLPLPVPGWELAGVTGAFAAARSLEDNARVVVLRGPHAGTGGRASELDRFDIIADEDLARGGPVTISGDTVVESITIGDQRIDTGHVLLDNGLQPENALARMAGMPSIFAADAGGDVIVTGSVIAAGGTLISVTGDAAGIAGNENATIQTASETGRMLAESIRGGPIPDSIPAGCPAWRPDGTHPVLPPQITGSTLVCPDEGITVAMVREAIDRGATTVNDVKRRTRAAMGACQGRDCLWTIRALLAGAGRDYTVPMTARPPVTGITVGELASLAMT